VSLVDLLLFSLDWALRDDDDVNGAKR